MNIDSVREIQDRQRSVEMSEENEERNYASPRCDLDVPHAMEVMEPMEPLEFLVLTKYIVYLHGDHAMVFMELSIIKPLDKFMKLGNNPNDLVVWSCIEEPVKCPEDEFLVHHGGTQTLRLCCSHW